MMGIQILDHGPDFGDCFIGCHPSTDNFPVILDQVQFQLSNLFLQRSFQGFFHQQQHRSPFSRRRYFDPGADKPIFGALGNKVAHRAGGSQELSVLPVLQGPGCTVGKHIRDKSDGYIFARLAIVAKSEIGRIGIAEFIPIGQLHPTAFHRVITKTEIAAQPDPVHIVDGKFQLGAGIDAKLRDHRVEIFLEKSVFVNFSNYHILIPKTAGGSRQGGNRHPPILRFQAFSINLVIRGIEVGWPMELNSGRGFFNSGADQYGALPGGLGEGANGLTGEKKENKPKFPGHSINLIFKRKMLADDRWELKVTKSLSYTKEKAPSCYTQGFYCLKRGKLFRSTTIF